MFLWNKFLCWAWMHLYLLRQCLLCQTPSSRSHLMTATRIWDHLLFYVTQGTKSSCPQLILHLSQVETSGFIDKINIVNSIKWAVWPTVVVRVAVGAKTWMCRSQRQKCWHRCSTHAQLTFFLYCTQFTFAFDRQQPVSHLSPQRLNSFRSPTQTVWVVTKVGSQI